MVTRLYKGKPWTARIPDTPGYSSTRVPFAGPLDFGRNSLWQLYEQIFYQVNLKSQYLKVAPGYAFAHPFRVQPFTYNLPRVRYIHAYPGRNSRVLPRYSG
eukprot:3156810-Rhodomonas_salina.1